MTEAISDLLELLKINGPPSKEADVAAFLTKRLVQIGISLENIVTDTERFTIDITGIACHAGGRPGEGVSAAVIAAHALSDLATNGWHGKIEKPEGEGTANTGIVQVGQGTNVIMPAMHILAEARSHNPDFRKTIITT